MYKEEKLAEIKAARESWEREHAEEFKKERKEQFQSDCGIPLKRVYTPLDLAEKGFDYMKDLGFPGGYPYIRGITPTMYREKFWSRAGGATYATPEESNKVMKSMIEAGGGWFWVSYDFPSQFGYDPGHPRAEGEIGKVGINMVSLRDWEIFLDGIDLGKGYIQQVYCPLSAVGLANYILLSREQGLDPKNMTGGIQNDILKDYIARGTYIFPIKHALRQAVDVMCYAAENMPNYKPLEVNSYQQAAKGANAVQEAASGLANAFTFLQAAVDRGVDVDLLAPGVDFVTTAEHDTFFEDIAKHRAMRRMWAKVLRDRFGAKKPESMQFRSYTRSAGNSCYQQEYLNNITRSVLGGLSAVLSGQQYIGFVPYDEALGIVSPEAVRFTIQTGQLFAYETDIPDVVDPLAGSYFIESLTSEIEERVWEELEAIEKHGGVVKCIEDGYFQRQYAENAHKCQRAFERGEIVRVGVNRFVGERQEKRATRVYRADPKVEQQRIAAVQELKRKRDNEKVKKALSEVKAVAAMEPSRENNIVLPIMEACRCYATSGEIADALREVWGEYSGIGSSVF